MLRNYLKIALRNLARHRGYAFINILGLAVGIAASVLVIIGALCLAAAFRAGARMAVDTEGLV